MVDGLKERMPRMEEKLLHYDVEYEILSDLFLEYREKKKDGADAIHKLGEKYLSLAQEFALSSGTCDMIRRLSVFINPAELEKIEPRLVHGYLTKKASIKVDLQSYHCFCENFSGDTRFAFEKIPAYLPYKTIPYTIKNRRLHIDVAENAAFRLGLDLDGILIEDGRHPRQIRMTRMTGERYFETEQERDDDGNVKIIRSPRCRIRFVNGQTDRPYQKNISSFSFEEAQGGVSLYRYASYPVLDPDRMDKLPWRRIFTLLESVTEKRDCLGSRGLNETELYYFPFLKMVKDLLAFYLLPSSISGPAISLVHFDEDAAAALSFDRQQQELSVRLAAEAGTGSLEEELQLIDSDRRGFCRFWIWYLSGLSSVSFYNYLMQLLEGCSEGYRPHPLPMAYRKKHMQVRDIFVKLLRADGWEGEFPYFYKERKPRFVEVSSVYSRAYTYLGEKKKGLYLDILTSVKDGIYTVKLLAAQILLQEEEDAGGYRALDGYFADGGRRRYKIGPGCEIRSYMDQDELEGLIRNLTQETRKIFSEI